MVKRGAMEKIPQVWVLLGLKHAAEIIEVIGFQLGDAAAARRVLAERTKEETYDDTEVFDLTLDAPRLRYQLELWLTGAGMSKEDAAEQVSAIANSLGKQFRQVMKRKKKR
jgi:HSP90 family molecular chaperone